MSCDSSQRVQGIQGGLEADIVNLQAGTVSIPTNANSCIPLGMSSIFLDI